MLKMMIGLFGKPSPLVAQKTPSSGFTLVELSVVIIILGLALGMFAEGYDRYRQQNNIDVTNKRTEKVVAKMFEFRNANGRYPCPASLSAQRNTAEYGKEVCTASAAGSCDATTGICTQRSDRTDITNRNILIGAIPFRSLNIPEDEAYDAYGSRIVVGVTQSLTDATTFLGSQGGINIRNDKNQDIYTPTASGQFVVLSPGKNRRGGYTKDGQLFRDCSGTDFEVANCDYMTGTATSASFLTSSHAETNDASHFDDVVNFDPGGAKEAWRWQGNQTDMVNMKADKVMLGMRDSGDNSPVEGTLNILSNSSNAVFDGSMNVRGELQTTEVCDDATSAKCFKPTNLSENCPPFYYFSGYLGGQPQCKLIYYGCKDREYLESIDPEGRAVCKDIYDGICGSAGGGSFYSEPGLSARCTDTRADTGIAFSGDTWSWTCKGSPGGTTNGCSAKLKIDAVCGSSSGKKLTEKPTSGLCSVGDESAVSGTAPPFSWTCSGYNGGNNASCGTNAPDPITGQCGSSENTCLSGSLSDTADDSKFYNWSCQGQYGGSTASCTAAKPILENGVCGGTVNACTSGTLNDTADDTTNFNWTCAGQNGGSSATCNLTKPPVTACTPGPVDAVNGVCGGSINECNAGSYNDIGDTSTNYKWQCLGSDGGSSASCAVAKPVTPPVVTPPSTPQPVNGACGGATGTCASGTVSGLNWFCVGLGQGATSWACKGLNGGTTAGCSVPKPECAESSF